MAKEIETLYNEHFEEMTGANNLDEYSETDVDRVLRRLLKCLPNDGKYYKYRKGEGQDFDYAYDTLEKGYIWLAQATTLNDDVDTTINFDPEKDIEDVKQYLLSHPIEVFIWLFRKIQESGDLVFGWDQLQTALFRMAIACYDLETGELNREEAKKVFLSFGCTEQECNSTLDKIDDFVKTYLIKNEDVLKKICDNYLTINRKFREMSYVFCVSECYDLDTMWAYYTNNKGFCIEYDFKKVLNLPIEKRRLFMNFCKVLYSDTKERFSFVPDIQYFLGGYKDKALLAESNRTKIAQLLTKQEKWEDEKEWRLFLCNTENKLYADLISAIYIENSMLDTDNGKKLLDLAKERNWGVYIRKLNYIGTKHIYEIYSR
ncbi:MAG: DUF2971 domain-containing protein [Clostridia bacterium]|nr:DUF2971 domain-containing protein [Clostridia bacterium]